MATTSRVNAATRPTRADALAARKGEAALRLAVAAFAGALLLAVALAGAIRVGGPSSAGLAMGVDRASVVRPGVTEIVVMVRNGSTQPVTGTLTASAPGGSARTTVDVAPGGSALATMSLRAPCGTAVALVLAGPDGPLRSAVATASCHGQGPG